MIKGFVLGLLVGLLVMYVLTFMLTDEFSDFYWIYAPLFWVIKGIVFVWDLLGAVIHCDSYWYLYKHCGINPLHVKASQLINLPREDKEYLYKKARTKSFKECWENLLKNY